jgi:hypothetical protein
MPVKHGTRTDAAHLRPERERYLLGLAPLWNLKTVPLTIAQVKLAGDLGLSLKHVGHVLDGSRSLSERRLQKLREIILDRLGSANLKVNDPAVLGCPTKLAARQSEGNAAEAPVAPRKSKTSVESPVKGSKYRVSRLRYRRNRVTAILLPADTQVEVKREKGSKTIVFTARLPT